MRFIDFDNFLFSFFFFLYERCLYIHIKVDILPVEIKLLASFNNGGNPVTAVKVTTLFSTTEMVRDTYESNCKSVHDANDL